MTELKRIKGGVCAPAGFLAGSVYCGIKAGNLSRPDFAMVVSEGPCVAAATFTTNKVKAPPVRLSMKHLEGKRHRAVVLNSGNANACTGAEGLAAARATARAAARELGARAEEVLVCSTGRIGVPLPVEKMVAAVPGLVSALSREGSAAAARAIMTSDTVSKEIAFEFKSGGKLFRIGGLAKGAGMIDPNMATMLSVLTTDADLPKAELQKRLRLAVDRSFNRITIDGDMSTNDTVILLANGMAGVPAKPDAFQDALDAAALDLAKKIVLDGEGVSRFIEVRIEGAASAADARRAAEAVANSTLTKCAWAGGDPNWGRIMDALGYSGARMNEAKTDIDYNGVAAVRGGMAAPTPFARLQKIAAKKAFVVTVRLHAGKAAYSVFTTDLTEAYVKFNLGE